MNTLRWLRLGVLGVLVFSAAAAVDGYFDSAAFCASGGGCDAVRRSASGRLLGGVLPGFGLVFYTLLFWGSTVENRRLRRGVLWAAVAGGLGGLALLALQWLQARAFCELCLGVDLFAIAVAIMAGLCLRQMPRRATSWPRSAWGALYLVAIAAPPTYALSQPEPVPSYVRARHVPGKINVVEVSDFECPYCRRLHRPLGEALEAYGERVNFVRIPYPLQGHRHARPASLAYLCAVEQGYGEPMADRLFSADLSQVTPQALARDLPLDQAAFATCMAAPATATRLEQGMREVAEGSLEGLPTVYIGHTVIRGFDSAAGSAPYEAALARAAEGDRPTHAPWPWLVLGGALLVLATLSSRSASGPGRGSAP